MLIIGILSGTIACKSMHLPLESVEIHFSCCLLAPAAADEPLEAASSAGLWADSVAVGVEEEEMHSPLVVQLCVGDVSVERGY